MTSSKFQLSDFENVGPENCCICLDDFEAGREVVTSTCCFSATFHEECISKHLRTIKSKLCPLCRHGLFDARRVQAPQEQGVSAQVIALQAVEHEALFELRDTLYQNN
jgi:hypothetical protein